MTVLAPTFNRLLVTWKLDPFLIGLLGGLGTLYLLGVRRRRRAWPVWRTALFLAGLAVLALALMSGIDSYADELLSVHMVQHMLLALLAPTLLLCGAPIRLALGSSSPAVRIAVGAMLASRPARALARPAIGVSLFATVMLTTHLTGLFELALEDQTVHAFEHAAYFWAGVLLLAPLIAADPLPHPPGALARFSWLMAAMTAMAVPGALLTFSTGVRYSHYLAPARALGRSALADQHVAGVIMWVGGSGAMFALALIVAMSAMLAEERRQKRRELYARDDGEAQRSAEVLRA